MPDDLLRYVSGPQAYSAWWLLIAALLILTLVGGYIAVWVWTLPAERLRALPILGVLHGRWIRRRFAARVNDIQARHLAGELRRDAAAAAISATLRSFLHVATGQRAQYMHLADIAEGPLAVAAPMIAALGDVQFGVGPTPDVDELGRSVQGLIHSWS